MGEGLLKVLDLLGATVAALQADNEQLRAEIARMRGDHPVTGGQ